MKNKIIIITGAYSGLGAELLKLAKEKGAQVIGLDLKTDHKKWVYWCDTSNYRLVQKSKSDLLFNSLIKNKVDFLINCAGINGLFPIEELQNEIWDNIMDTNAKGILNCTKVFLPELEKASGTVVNVISNAKTIPMTHSLAYNASKAAAAMMTRQMARELTKSKGITVFGVCPNKMENTSMSKYIEEQVKELRGWTEEEAKKYQLAALPAGFETKPEWIAELIIWLLEKDHRHKYLTGCLLELGGPTYG